jgi:tyrosine-protein kinase Etk/Wzc
MQDNHNESIATMLMAFLRDLFSEWKILLISLVVLVGGTVLYIKVSAKTYRVRSSVVLNVKRSNAFGAQTDDLLKVYELIEQDKILQNEIYLFKSSPLIRSVVEDMNLLVSYFVQGDKIPAKLEFSMRELYNDSPIMVVPDREHLQPVNINFYFRILDEDSFVISASGGKTRIVNFRDGSVLSNSTAFQLNGTYRFGEVIGNTYSSFRVILNSNYNADIYQGKDLFFRFNTNDDLTKQFKSALNVTQSELDATIVEMTFNSDNVQKGIDFLGKLIDEYIDNNLNEKNYLANKTIEHLDFQLSDISESLGSSEMELQNIRRSSSVINIDEQAGNIYTQLQVLESQKADIERRRSYLVQMEEYITSNQDTLGFIAPSAMGLNDQQLNELIRELTTLITEKQQIISNNQLRNPRLRTLDANIGNMKKVILENVNYSIDAANAELREINSRIRALNTEFTGLPYTQRRLLGIERKFNLSENVYMTLLEQRIQAQIIKASNLPDCKVIEPPQFASVQSPKSMILLILAGFIGVLIPSVYVMMKKLFTTRILDKDELKKHTSIPVIGNIPVENRSTINAIVNHPNSITAEAFHSVRSNLIYYLMGKTNQVILVTSTMEGEGKSFAALNLASSLAVTNNRTALVEFDLRCPSELYSRMGLRGLVGVSSYLINKASLDEITIKSEIDNLDFILAGQIPPNPIELISSKQAEEFFGLMRKKYDYIVIDTPPYGVLTDSFVLMKYSDINLYVSRLGYVKRQKLLDSFEDIETKGIEKIHILLNGVVPKQGTYGKYYTTPRKGNGLFGRKQKKSPETRHVREPLEI